MKQNGMKLITQELKKRFKEVGDQDEFNNPLVIAKIHSAKADMAWYLISYNHHVNAYYGYVTGGIVDEFRYFSVERLENRRKSLNLDLKRDIHFKEIRFYDLFPEQKRVAELNRAKKEKPQEQER